MSASRRFAQPAASTIAVSAVAPLQSASVGDRFRPMGIGELLQRNLFNGVTAMGSLNNKLVIEHGAEE